VNRLGVWLAVALIANTAAWYGASGTTNWSTQIGWILLSIAAVTVGAASCARWVIAGLRSTRWQRAEIAGAVERAWPAAAVDRRRTEFAGARENAPVATETMTRFHRASCQFVVGKSAVELTHNQIAARHLAPCEVCTP
jgi:hypothetical protein